MKLFSEIKATLLQFRLLFYKSKQPLVIVTGSSSSHYKSLVQLLESLMIYESNTKIIVYDLGLQEGERKYINANFTNTDLRVFNFDKYPDYFNIHKDNGKYAWKPVIINDILNEYKCSVCWLDGGNVIKKPLNELRKIIELYGFYSPYSKGTIRDWTHPKTLSYFNITNNDYLLKKNNLNGANVAANYNNSEVKSLINEWKKCALIEECIAPKGSSRKNHRFDQAVLSILIYQNLPNLGKKMMHRKFGFKTHQDID
jgi:hypothetical protein